MASNFEFIYEKIRSAIPTLTGFDTKTEIPNPLDLEDNNFNFIRDGWGVKVNTSIPQIPTYKLKDYVQSQEFEIILTKNVPTTSSNADVLIAAIKTIRNDINTIAEDFTTTRFGFGDQVQEVNINTITSIDNVAAGKLKHITASIIFEILHWR